MEPETSTASTSSRSTGVSSAAAGAARAAAMTNPAVAIVFRVEPSIVARPSVTRCGRRPPPAIESTIASLAVRGTISHIAAVAPRRPNAKYDSLEFQISRLDPPPRRPHIPLLRHDDRAGHPLALMLEADITIGAGHGELVGEGLARGNVAGGEGLSAHGYHHGVRVAGRAAVEGDGVGEQALVAPQHHLARLDRHCLRAEAEGGRHVDD